MNHSRRALRRFPTVRLGLIGCAAALPLGHAAAQEVVGSVDVSASAGYSSNPFLSSNGEGSGYVEGAIRPNLAVTDALGQTNFGAYYSRKEYFKHYDGTNSYGVSGRGQRKLSETVDVRALLAFDSSIIGAGDPDGDQVIDPSLPPNPDIGLIGTRQRRNSLNSSVGMTARVSARDSLSVDLNASKAWYGKSSLIGLDYVSYGGQVAYNHALSERSSIGASFGYTEIDYDGFGQDARILSPQLTYSTTFAPGWTLNAGAGVSISTLKLLTGHKTDTSLAGQLEICREQELGNLCFGGSRSSSATGYGGVRTFTDIHARYSRRVSEKGTVHAGARYSINDRNRQATISGKQEYLTLDAGYSHRLGERLSLNADVGYRDSYGLLAPDADIWGRVGISYRLGDRR